MADKHEDYLRLAYFRAILKQRKVLTPEQARSMRAHLERSATKPAQVKEDSNGQS